MKENPFILEVEKVSKRYTQQNGEAFMALSDVGFMLRPGEILGVIGKNGSGKSTLLKMLAGFIKPSEGIIKIGGKSVGIIDVGSGFHPDLTGLENIRFILRFHAAQKPDELEKFIIQFAELGDFIYEPIKKYSSGMFMRLALSTYLNMDFQVLFIDEVFSTGDADFQQKVKTFILTRKKELTLVLASHDLHLIATLADSCIWLKNGKVHRQGITKSIIEEYIKDSLSHLESFENLLNNQIVEQPYENEILKINSIKICQEESNDELLYHNFPFEVEVKLKIKVNNRIAFAFRINDIMDKQLHIDSPFFKTDEDVFDEPGEVIIRVIYPGLIFSFGLYLFKLVLWIDEENAIELSKTFQFELNKSNYQLYSKALVHQPAISQMPLSWTISKIN